MPVLAGLYGSAMSTRPQDSEPHRATGRPSLTRCVSRYMTSSAPPLCIAFQPPHASRGARLGPSSFRHVRGRSRGRTPLTSSSDSPDVMRRLFGSTGPNKFDEVGNDHVKNLPTLVSRRADRAAQDSRFR